jgi:hypothetical protein
VPPYSIIGVPWSGPHVLLVQVIIPRRSCWCQWSWSGLFLEGGDGENLICDILDPTKSEPDACVFTMWEMLGEREEGAINIIYVTVICKILPVDSIYVFAIQEHDPYGKGAPFFSRLETLSIVHNNKRR